jgi:hypothetical protein
MTWYKIEKCDYMDMYPTYSYKLFESSEDAATWALRMMEAYSGGTTRLVGMATKQEIVDYINRYNIDCDETLTRNINNPDYYGL